MKRGIRILLAVLTAFTFFLTPAASLIAPHSAAVVSAHGHRGGHHGSGQNTVTDYYYCHGHDAHTHDNGVCPYYDDHCNDPVYNSSDYYYCHGHDAHTHENDICPYYGDHCGDTYSSGSGSTSFSQGYFSHMHSENGHRQHCRFLIPTATGLSLL